MKNKIIELLTWAKNMLGYSYDDRKAFAIDVMTSLKNVSEHGEGHPDKKAGQKIYENLSNFSEWTLMGFCPNVQYIKLKDSDKKGMQAVWVHPFGTETLIFIHKKLPLIVLTNPGIRFDKTLLSEMKISHEDYAIKGISG